MGRLKFYGWTIINTFALVVICSIFKWEAAATIISVCLFLVGELYLVVKRLHDIGMSAFWLIGLVIPFLNIYVHFMVNFAPTGYEVQGHENCGKEDFWFFLGIVLVLVQVIVVLVTL